MLRNSFVLIVLLSLMGCPAYADNHDLSGNTYPIGEVSFNSDTVDKTEKILDCWLTNWDMHLDFIIMMKALIS